MKYIDYVRQKLSTDAFPVFSISDLRIALKDKGISNDYLYILIHTLLKKKEIIRITKGVYTFHDDAAVVGFAFKPFYYGLENALAIRGISGQGMNFTIITSRSVRVGNRNFNGRNYSISRIDKRLLFGYDLVKYSRFWLPVSDIEKSAIDMVYFRYVIRDELLDGIRENIDKKKLNKYLEYYKPDFKLRVLKALRMRG